MYRLKIFFLLAAVSSLSLQGLSQRQTGTDKTLKVDIDLVLVNVSVTDSDNRPVTDLKPENFQLAEDRIDQEIGYFSTETTPVSLGMIFDSSHSMEGKINLAKNAAVTFLENGTPSDEYFLVEFNSRARVAQEF